MLSGDSPYLLSFDVFKRGLDQAIENGVPFDLIGSDDPQGPGGVEITSDDGGGSAMLLAEHLKLLGIRAKFFIVTAWIGRDGFLAGEEIQYIHSLGHVIGSHSHTHPNPFCDLRRGLLRKEVLHSREVLEGLLGVAVDSFSVPGGELRRGTIRELQAVDLGLSRIYTSTPYQGAYLATSTSTVLGRYCIMRSMDSTKTTRVIEGRGWVWNRMRYKIGRTKREALKTIPSWINWRPGDVGGGSA